MSEIRVDNITNEAGTGSPGFSQGLPADALTGNVAADRITDALNATGSAPIYACRAWVSIQGGSFITILGSANVSSIVRNGPGDYTVNFTNSMPDTDYAAVATCENSTVGDALAQVKDLTTSSLGVFTFNTSNSLGSKNVRIAVIR